MSERLYTPWRLKYILSDEKKMDGCVFCTTLQDNPKHDSDKFLLYRADEVFAIMNIYPYNVGHVMVLPNRHVSTLTELSRSAQCEMIGLTSYFVDLLTGIMKPDGFNVGMNIGKAAGSGIDTHLHTHIVPRWHGDSNFMPVMGQTRILAEELGDTFNKISAGIKQNPPVL